MKIIMNEIVMWKWNNEMKIIIMWRNNNEM